jgi:multiple sugar transport system permease protein
MTIIAFKARAATRAAGRASSEDDPSLAKSKVSKFFGRLALAIVILITLFPIYWMFRTAFSNNRSMFAEPLSLLPVDFTWGPLRRVLGLATPAESLAEGGSGASINFAQYMLNSIAACTLITVLQVTFSSMAAYAFALLNWKGRDKVFSIFLIALMVPSIFTLLPNFILVKDMGLLNTILGIALPSMFMTPFAIFFLRQFFIGINRSIIEAAVIDGANQWRIFRGIVVPLAWPQIITLTILQFIQYWNDYLWPFLVGQSEQSKLLTVGLGIFKSQTPQGNPDWAGLMAGALVAAVPIFILMLVFGRKIVGSIQSSGVK